MRKWNVGFKSFDLGKERMEGWWSFWSAIKENGVEGNQSNKWQKEELEQLIQHWMWGLMLTKMRILVLWYQLKHIRILFGLIKATIMERNPMDIDEDDV